MKSIPAPLFAAAQAGDPAALACLLETVQPDIRRFARRQCHRSSMLDDVVQEALIVVCRRVGSVRDAVALPGWLLRMVTRLCMLPLLGLMRGVEQISESHEARLLAHLPQDDLRIDLLRALDALPEPHRQVILLRDFEQLTLGEVAERLGVSREAAKSRLHRARSLMREYLLDDEADAQRRGPERHP